jgi:hypothetical protein
MRFWNHALTVCSASIFMTGCIAVSSNKHCKDCNHDKPAKHECCGECKDGKHHDHGKSGKHMDAKAHDYDGEHTGKHEGTHAELTSTESDIAVTDLPTAVLTSFQAKMPGMTIKKAEKEVYSNGMVHYEIEYTDAAGKSKDVEFDATGEVLDDH